MHRQEPKAVLLLEAMPVKFIYQTAIVDEVILMNFRQDVYGHDAMQATAIS